MSTRNSAKAKKGPLCPCGSGRSLAQCCGDKKIATLMVTAVSAHQRGMFDAARQVYLQILQSSPDHADAIHYLGLLNFQLGHFSQAVEDIQRAITLRPEVAAYRVNLANALKRLDRFQEAIETYDQALALDPRQVGAYFNKALLLRGLGRTREAIGVLQQLLQIAPLSAEAWQELGFYLHDEESIDAAADALQQALKINPGLAPAHLRLGSILQRFGNVDGAIKEFSLAERNPECGPEASAMRLFALAYTDMAPETLLAEHQDWERRYCPPPAPAAPPFVRAAGSRLRIGYLSPDLRRHAMRFFVRPMLAHHDSREFDVVAYSTALPGQNDSVTDELRALAPSWVDCAALSPEAIAEQIRRDRIDILVDLAGHTGRGQMAVLAGRPAPVQCTMLGYMTTLGASFIDARITDGVAVPPGRDPWFSERLVRLPHSQWCFVPDADSPPVTLAPSRPGFPRFGAFHNTAKMNGRVLGLWVRLLQALPDASLLLVAWGKKAREYLERPFREAGVLDRLRVVEPQGYAQYLALYGEVDISLDVFPYGGGTVLCESLWMGVPVLALAHDSPAGRGGASILSAAGLPGWIARDEDDFLRLARELSGDPASLLELRSGLRSQMEKSPLMDAPAYVLDLEAGFRSLVR